MDIRMPVMDGYEATQRIKSQAGAQAPTIIALTAHAFEEERAAILAAGCDDFVRKPFREEEIFDKMAKQLGVRYVYEESRQVRPELSRRVDKEEGTLTPADLAALPADWVAELRQAAMGGEAELVLALIDRLELGYASLAGALAQLVREFRFGEIVALCET